MSGKSEPCWVCGTPTASTCGPCARAGNRIFFCSREHQKVVWKTHKRVCGQPGFCPPFLSKKDATEALSYLNRPLPDCDGMTVGLILQAKGLRKEFLFDFLAEGSSAERRPTLLDLLNLIRFAPALLEPKGEGAGGGGGHISTFKQPFNAMAMFQLRFPCPLNLAPDGRPINGYDTSPTWLGLLQYRILLFITLYAETLDEHGAKLDDGSSENMAALLDHTKRAIFDFIHCDIATAEDGGEWEMRALVMMRDIWNLGDPVGRRRATSQSEQRRGTSRSQNRSSFLGYEVVGGFVVLALSMFSYFRFFS